MKSKIFKIFGVMATVAIMAGSLAAPALAISTPLLDVDDEEISAVTEYTLTFTLGLTLPHGADAIILTGDDGIDFDTITAATIETGPGLGSNPVGLTSIIGAVTTAVEELKIDTTGLSADGQLGAGTIIQLVLTGVTNPSSVGDYKIEVETAEESAVASNTFTTTVPEPDPLPGIARVYNDGDVLMNQFTSLASAITLVGTNADWKITLTAGTYDEPVLSAAAGLTIQGIGDAEDVIIEPNTNFTLTGAEVTVTGVTFDLSEPFVFAGADVVVEDCLFVGSAATGLVTLSGADATMDDCTVDTTDDPVSGVTITGANAVIQNCTFEVDEDDVAIVADGAGSEIDSNTFNGNSAKGIEQDADVAIEVTSNTFNGLDQVYSCNNTTGTLAFTGNTVDNCGVDDTDAVFGIVSTGGIEICNNVISNSNWYIAVITDDAEFCTVVFNNLTGNTLGFDNNSGDTLVAVNNFWGGPTGPADDMNTDDVDDGNFLGLVPSSAVIDVDEDAVSNSTAGFSMELEDDDARVMGAASYAANPTGAAVPSAYTAVRYLDALVYDPDDTDDTAVITIDGVTGAAITGDTVVMYYDADYNVWRLLTVTAQNTYGNYIVVEADVAVLDGTPLVVAETNPTVPDSITPDDTDLYPSAGSVDIPIDVTLSWPAADGATGYEITIAEDLDAAPGHEFDIIDTAANCSTNAYKVNPEAPLKYNTQYWWRVRPVNDVGPGSWLVNFFTTEKEPPPPPTTTEPTTTTTTTTTTMAPPQVTVTVETQEPITPVVTVTVPETKVESPIPTYLLWVVVAVGAVLLIAVVVLIVRTRRIT